MRNVLHPPPTRPSSGPATFGTILNWSRLIDSHGIDGYGWRGGLRSLPVSRRDLLAESRKHSTAKLLRQIPSIGAIRAALLIALIQTPYRFRTKRQLWP